MRHHSICYGIVILLFISGCSWFSAAPAYQAGPVKLPVTSPVLIDTVFYMDYIADICSKRNISILTRVDGFLDSILVDEGQAVIKGQRLFKIDGQEFKTHLAKANADLKSSIAELKAIEVDLQRVRLLVENKVVTSTELEMMEAKREAGKAKIEESESALRNAELKLSYTNITAPFNGIMGHLPLKAGSFIAQGSLLSSLSDNEQVFAYFNVTEHEYLNMASNSIANIADQEVELMLANGSKHNVKGKIETIDDEFEKSTGNIAFRARFPNPDKLLRNGSSGKVRLTKFMRNALVIPQKATFEIQDKIYVYVVGNNNQVKSRSFETLFRFPHFFVVASGLTVKDKIVYEGIQNVRDDTQIVPEFFPMAKILSALQ